MYTKKGLLQDKFQKTSNIFLNKSISLGIMYWKSWRWSRTNISPRYTTLKLTLLTIFSKNVVSIFYPAKNQWGVIKGHLNISKCINKITTISHWKGRPRPSPNTLPRHTIPKPLFLIIFRSKNVCPFFTPHPKSGAKKVQRMFSVVCQYHCGKVSQHLESHSGHTHNRPEFNLDLWF